MKKLILGSVGDALKTLRGSRIARSRRYGVGKEIGGQIYFHKQYASIIVPEDILNTALDILHEKYPQFKYNCMRFNPKTQVVSFQEVPDFNTAREPRVGDYINVNTMTGEASSGHSDFIFHHKWLWVDNSYTGFDVEESWNWSKYWLSVLTETSDGTGISRWNSQLDRFGLPHDD